MHKTFPLAWLAVITFCNSGCGTVSTLKSTTISQSGSAMEIVDQMILDNLALASVEDRPLPWHVQVTQGSIGITDSASPNASYTWSPVSRVLGITGSRSWAVSWTIVPELDFQKLNDLRDIYSAATHPKLSDTFATGTSPPSGVMYGKYKTTYIWVQQSKAKDFGDFVIQILTKAPVAPSQRTVLLPGVQH